VTLTTSEKHPREPATREQLLFAEARAGGDACAPRRFADDRGRGGGTGGCRPRRVVGSTTTASASGGGIPPWPPLRHLRSVEFQETSSLGGTDLGRCGSTRR